MTSSSASNTAVHYGETTRISVAAHIPRPHARPAPCDPAELKKKRDQRAQTASEIATAVEKWHDEIRATADSLSAKFEKTPQYFLELLFNKPTQLKSTREPNLRNAFAWKLSQGQTTSTCTLP